MLQKMNGCKESCEKCTWLCQDLWNTSIEIQDDINGTLEEISKHSPNNFDETYKILWSNIDIKLKIKDLVAKLTAL